MVLAGSPPLVAEVYTDTRPIVREAARRGHPVGQSYTLASGWNFYKSADRQACIRATEKEKP